MKSNSDIKFTQPIVNSPIFTFVLYGETEYAVKELITVVKNAIVVLTHMVHSPYALMGAGYTELHLAEFLQSQVIFN